MASALRGVDHWGRERVCGSGGGEGARTPLLGSPPRHVSYLPLTSPSWARGSPPFTAPSPAPGFPWAPTPATSRLQSAPPPPPRQPRPRPPSRPVWFPSARPGLHAASWAAGAGAGARGFSFTRSLKYFGKPQSGAAGEWPLACFGELGGGTGAWAKIRESDCPLISKIGPHGQVSPWPWGDSRIPGQGGVSWAPSDAECAPQKSANFK